MTSGVVGTPLTFAGASTSTSIGKGEYVAGKIINRYDEELIEIVVTATYCGS